MSKCQQTSCIKNHDYKYNASLQGHNEIDPHVLHLIPSCHPPLQNILRKCHSILNKAGWVIKPQNGDFSSASSGLPFQKQERCLQWFMVSMQSGSQRDITMHKKLKQKTSTLAITMQKHILQNEHATTAQTDGVFNSAAQGVVVVGATAGIVDLIYSSSSRLMNRDSAKQYMPSMIVSQ